MLSLGIFTLVRYFDCTNVRPTRLINNSIALLSFHFHLTSLPFLPFHRFFFHFRSAPRCLFVFWLIPVKKWVTPPLPALPLVT